jgi:hypothetical protein
MVEANILIINELRYFLDTVSKDPEFRKLVAIGDSDFSRTRKLPLERVAGIILNMPKRSLCIEIQEFFDCLGNDLAGCTKGAFSLQRSKLNPLFFKAWNKWLVHNFYHYYGQHVRRWRGFMLQAVDGSSVYLLDKKEIIEYFGKCGGNQRGGTPMARVVQIHDVLNGITLWGDIYPIDRSERSIITGQVPNFNIDSITLFDRGFSGYGLAYLMLNEESPRHFVIRCKVDFNEQIKQFARNKKGSIITELTPSKNSIDVLRQNGYIVTKKTTITVRMVKFMLPSGEMEILITNLYDETKYSVADLKYLYGLRWGIEGRYSKQKNQLQMEQFSGYRVICVQQDYAAMLFVANLQKLIEKQSHAYLNRVSQTRKFKYQINCNVSWAALKHNIVRLLLLDNPYEILMQLQQAFERNLEPIRPDRHLPRNRKTRRQNGKYQTYTNYKRAI